MDNHQKREKWNHWLKLVWGAGALYATGKKRNELKRELEPDGKCVLMHMIPAGQVMTPMQGDEFIVFVEHLDTGLLGDKYCRKEYGRYNGEVVINHPDGRIIVIGEVYGKAFCIPTKGWKRGIFAAERDGANEVR